MQTTVHKAVYNPIGQVRVVTKQCRFEDLECFVLPESCSKCPVAYSKYNCGRNVPMRPDDFKQRPATCKLKLVE